jgi:Domain of unknown function (DUF397)
MRRQKILIRNDPAMLWVVIDEGVRVPASAVAVRDSKDPDGPRLVVTPDEWRAFAAGVKAGEFDLS